MIIAPKHNFVFICMPKCASTATEVILRRYGQIILTGSKFKHMPFRGYERFLLPMLKVKMGVNFNQLEVICLFREPIDWLYSWYRYRKRPNLLRRNDPRLPKLSTAGMSFEEFAREYVAERPRHFAAVGRQINMVRNSKGNVGNIKLFRYEDYDKFLLYMSQKLDVALQAPKMNVSPAIERTEETNLPFLREFLAPEYELYSRIERL